MLRRFWRGERSEDGQAVVIIAVVFTALLMTVGLAIDAGQLFVARRTAQEAADAGAYAGAVVLYEGGTSAQAQAIIAATTDITTNGYTDAGVGGFPRVTVNAPPTLVGTTSPYYEQPQYVEVQITVQVPTSLLPQQAGLTTVSVFSVAGAVPLNKSFGLMALDRGSVAKALDVEQGGLVTVTGAGILVNSTSTSGAAYDQCSTGVGAKGCPNVNASPVDVNGSWTGTGWSTTPTSGFTQQVDPFAGYPKPSTSGLGSPITTLPNPVNGAVTLSPGIYAVPVDYSGQTTVTLLSGTYILEAGMNGSGKMDFQTVAGGGVFIFNTLSNYPNSGVGDTCGGVQITGNATTNMSPEPTGPYAGLLFYQDPACTTSFTIGGNGSVTVSGTIYVPKGAFVMNGNNATLSGSQVVADTVSVQNGDLSITFNSGSTAQPVLPRLVQ
jgi:Flp pilus assembly protein TadG